jgi:hypothetical protein
MNEGKHLTIEGVQSQNLIITRAAATIKWIRKEKKLIINCMINSDRHALSSEGISSKKEQTF